MSLSRGRKKVQLKISSSYDPPLPCTSTVRSTFPQHGVLKPGSQQEMKPRRRQQQVWSNSILRGFLWRSDCSIWNYLSIDAGTLFSSYLVSRLARAARNLMSLNEIDYHKSTGSGHAGQSAVGRELRRHSGKRQKKSGESST